jgi:hypothetical protein
LIGQGRTGWAAAVADPDSLADVVTVEEADVTFEGEAMLSVAIEAYEQTTGDGEPFWATPPADGGGSSAVGTGTIEPAGEEFDFDDERQMRIRLPRLSRIFLDDDDES